ncbi:MAG TPA: hypothetical protein VGM39_10360 [Kofleriaceae bacterium]|jgi:tetratricopeptide (TPR) repeat protein
MRAVLVAALLSSAVAYAEEPPVPVERPWAKGVSEDKQSEALALFNRANAAFAQNDYTTAAQLYRKALEVWDHPAIRGNLAVALIQLDQPVEAYLQLERAFAYEAAPFDANVYAQLQTNYKLLKGQISRIVVVGDVQNASMSLDGGPLQTGRKIVRAGTHELVVRRIGYLTFSRNIVTEPDSDHTIDVKLVPLEDASKFSRRFASWKPWAVAGGGAALALVGVGFELAARGNVDDYEKEISRDCPNGCVPKDIPSSVKSLKDRAYWETRVGITSVVVGGAAIAAGLTLVVLNQPRRLRVDESGRVITLVPTVSESGAGFVAAGSF